jgi:hypothetical protein
MRRQVRWLWDVDVICVLMIVGGVLLQALVHPAYGIGAWIAGAGVVILIVLNGFM